jgi:tripeptidyl-peptidase-1
MSIRSKFYIPSFLFMVVALLMGSRVMKDVTEGGNRGCGTPGFSAVEGWDPGKSSLCRLNLCGVDADFVRLATGLGTPIFPKMLDLFMSLP